MQAALLSGRRTTLPPGLHGGEPGRAGAQRLLRADGAVAALPAKFSIQVDAGDIVEIETPGGGGYGKRP